MEIRNAGAQKRSKTMKKLNAVVRVTFCLATMFAIVFLVQAESGDRRTSMPQTQIARRAIRIFDQNGQPAVNGVPSATGAIVDVTVGPGGDVFVPDTVNISVGDTVRWTWAESGHSVTSGPPCDADSQFCSPDDMNCAAGILSNAGTVYTHTFARAWHLFLLLRRALRYWHEWGGQCFGWLRAVGMVSRSGLAKRGQGGWRLFPGQRELLRHGRPHLRCMAAMTSSTRSNMIPRPTAGPRCRATLPDNQMNNMACGVLTVSGTPYIYCVGGSQLAAPQPRLACSATTLSLIRQPCGSTTGPAMPGHDSAWWLHGN